MPHAEAKIVDPVTGVTAPVGVPGEICTRGYLVMRGYWNNAEATAEAIDVDGWMHTGDIGVMDEEGYVNIVGRIKDMVIRGGENVYPREIEEVLFEHPDDRRRAGDRRARRAHGRGAHGVGAGAARAPRSVRTTCARSAGAARALQGAALREVRRRVPDDGHRQDPEVPHAGDRHRGARPHEGRRGQDRVSRMPASGVTVGDRSRRPTDSRSIR